MCEMRAVNKRGDKERRIDKKKEREKVKERDGVNRYDTHSVGRGRE